MDERVIHKSNDLSLIIAAISSNFMIEKSFIIYLNYYLLIGNVIIIGIFAQYKNNQTLSFLNE